MMLMKKHIEKLKKYFKSFDYKHNKLTVIVYVLLRVAVLAALVLNLLKGEYENVFLCVLTLFLFLMPFIIEEQFNISISPSMQIIILLFIFSAEILGEIQSFYLKFEYWDVILHTINGFLMGAIGFSLIDLLNTSEKISIKLTPFFVVFTAFCFSMTIGVMWEFFEFGMDKVLLTDTQKDTWVETVRTVEFGKTNKVETFNIESVEVNGKKWPGYLDIGLNDTMNDMIVNFLGAITFSVLGYISLIKRGKQGIEKLLIVKRET